MDFHNKIAKLYKLYSLRGDDYYIGSTFDNLERRIKKHYKAYDEYLNDERKHNESFEIFDKYKDNIFIELIKEFKNVKTKEELKIQREEYIRKLKNTNISKQKLTRAEYAKEWKNNNKEHLHDYYQRYYIKNIDRIKERYMERWVCEVCNINLNKWSKTRHEKSKSHQNMLNNNIQSKHKRTTCQCGCTTIDIPYYINKHLKTQKHKRFMELLSAGKNNEE